MDMMSFSNYDCQDLKRMNVNIPECEGLPRRLWNTMCVTLHNIEGILVGEGICHIVNSDLVLGANGPLGTPMSQSTFQRHIMRRTFPKR